MTWISGRTSIPIVHAMKRLKNNFGHIHFHARDDVESFCATVKEKHAIFPNGIGRRNIKCSRATGEPKTPRTGPWLSPSKRRSLQEKRPQRYLLFVRQMGGWKYYYIHRESTTETKFP